MRTTGKHGWRGLTTDLFTGATGEAWAWGRVWGAALLVVGVIAPFVMWPAGLRYSLAELGIYWGALAGAVAAVVTVTNMTEPKAPPEKGE